jgi:hypothetical protein
MTSEQIAAAINQLFGLVHDIRFGKVDKNWGRTLSSNDYTPAQKQKLKEWMTNRNFQYAISKLVSKEPGKVMSDYNFSLALFQRLSRLYSYDELVTAIQSINMSLKWVADVINYDDLAIQYPKPELWQTVEVLSEGKIYRWNGWQWVWILTSFYGDPDPYQKDMIIFDAIPDNPPPDDLVPYPGLVMGFENWDPNNPDVIPNPRLNNP